MQMSTKEEDKYLNKFVSLFLKNKEYCPHSDIDEYLTFKVKGILNYEELLDQEDKEFISQTFGENYRILENINEDKKDKI